MRVHNKLLGAFALAACLSAAPAGAQTLTFHAKLDGKYGDNPTGSAATGTARVTVDTAAKTVSVDLEVDGIRIDALWDTLVAAPIGPVHFHKYASAAGGASALALPLPYGADYRATERGLRVTTKDYDYVAGAALLKSGLAFEDFVAAMRGGLVILNVHTDAFNSGEISGRIAEG
ncbi:CHRD domain-containing protein [Sphingomonas sp.]|uniref:CHRD domain-containing protein n=1 Tax=Sphingomonas sp. TaxID=28214 RepID=UPI002ED8CA4A